MLKTITKSANKKLGGAAATYRSGSESMYGSCPGNCPLKPAGHAGAQTIDQDYLRAVLDAVPEEGASWTYTHFKDQDSLEALPTPTDTQTVINVSADTMDEAVNLYLDGHPTVVAVPKHLDAKVDYVEADWGEKVRFVRCPAEYREEANCSNCGGKNKPLCARGSRSYVIKFTAHGTQAKKVGSEEAGGCYGSSGPVAIQWKNTMTKTPATNRSDAEVLTDWVKTLPKGTLVRHHVVGDLG